MGIPWYPKPPTYLHRKSFSFENPELTFQLRLIMICEAEMARLAELIFSGTWLGIKGVHNMVPQNPRLPHKMKLDLLFQLRQKICLMTQRGELAELIHCCTYRIYSMISRDLSSNFEIFPEKKIFFFHEFLLPFRKI